MDNDWPCDNCGHLRHDHEDSGASLWEVGGCLLDCQCSKFENEEASNAPRPDHGPECFCQSCVDKDDMTTRRCPSCGSRECPGDGHEGDCRVPGTMTLKDVPTETKDSLLDKFNRGEIDEATLRRRMKQVSSIRALWRQRRAGIEVMEDEFFHGTCSLNLPRIKKYGLHQPFLTAEFNVAEYFAREECAALGGGKPIVLRVIVPDESMLIGDKAMIEEPVGEFDEDALAEFHERGKEPTWQDSIDLVGSARFSGDIPPEAISIAEFPGEWEGKASFRDRWLSRKAVDMSEIRAGRDYVTKSDMTAFWLEHGKHAGGEQTHPDLMVKAGTKVSVTNIDNNFVYFSTGTMQSVKMQGRHLRTGFGFFTTPGEFSSAVTPKKRWPGAKDQLTNLSPDEANQNETAIYTSLIDQGWNAARARQASEYTSKGGSMEDIARIYRLDKKEQDQLARILERLGLRKPTSRPSEMTVQEVKSVDPDEELSRLVKLKDEGKITPEQFQDKAKRLFGFKTLFMLRKADVAARIPLLHKQFFPDMTPDQADKTLRWLSQADPTGDQGKYLPWLAKSRSTGDVESYTDQQLQGIKNLLSIYDKVKKVKEFPPEFRDINRLRYHDVADAVEKYEHLRPKGEEERELIETGQRVVAPNDYGLKITEITTPEAAAKLCRETSWCVKDPSYSRDYLRRGPLFMITEVADDEPVAMVHPASGQITDAQDQPIGYELWKELKTLKFQPIKDAVEKSIGNWDDDDLINAISEGMSIKELDMAGGDITALIDYAKESPDNYEGNEKGSNWAVIMLEDALIETDLIRAMFYAMNSGYARWPALERAILEKGDAKAAFEYASKLLKARFPQAEHLILKDPELKQSYESRFGLLVPLYKKKWKKQWPEAAPPEQSQEQIDQMEEWEKPEPQPAPEPENQEKLPGIARLNGLWKWRQAGKPVPTLDEMAVKVVDKIRRDREAGIAGNREMEHAMANIIQVANMQRTMANMPSVTEEEIAQVQAKAEALMAGGTEPVIAHAMPIKSSLSEIWAKKRKKHSPAYDKETALINENKKKPEAKKQHEFKPASWTFPNGHPRCLVCGAEEIIGGICNKTPTAKDYADFEEELRQEFGGELPSEKNRREHVEAAIKSEAEKFATGETTMSDARARIRKLAGSDVDRVAEDAVLNVILESGSDRMEYGLLLSHVADAIQQRSPGRGQESYKVLASNAVHRLFGTFRLTRDHDTGMVYMQSDLQMTADQIYQLFSTKPELTWDEIENGMRKAGHVIDENVMYQALNYLMEDEGLIESNGKAYVATGMEPKTVQLPPAPGSKPVSEVMGDLPTVNVEEEKNRLLDEYSQGKLTQVDLEQKLRRLEASAMAKI
jgi:hypothetical protein